MKGSLAGTRIRERRRQLELKQSTLAQTAGISASYLNLIEHNRRTVSGKVLGAIAKALGLDPNDLAEGAESQLVEDLRQVLADHPDQATATTAIEEFIGRFPGWARIVATQARQIKDDRAAIATFMDRQNFDPHLQNTLHEMLTTITAIRSTSGILTTEEDIDTPQRSRFQNIIHDESRRLSDAAQELVSYFDHAQEVTTQTTSSQDAFETFLTQRDHVFEELEDTNAPAQVIADILRQDLPRATAETRAKLRERMAVYAQDAALMPLADFLALGQKTAFSPDLLSATFGADLHATFRRLATLKRRDLDVPRFGLVIVNAAGQPQFRRPLEDFSLPRFTSICALWPAFQALSVPGQPLSDIIVLPNGREFLARAIALSGSPTAFGRTPSFSSAMLVTSLSDAHRFGMLAQQAPHTPRQVGTSCRLCQQIDCFARSEPSILPPAPAKSP